MHRRAGFGFAFALACVVLARMAALDSAVPQATSIAPVPCENKQWTKPEQLLAGLTGARLISGEYAGGLYRIEVPDKWNGELVFWAHGLISSGGPNGLTLRVPPTPIRQHLITQGFAWAASSYRCNGYVPGQGLIDTLALRDLFVRTNSGNAPSRTYLMGASMGGHAALVAAHALPTAFDGTLALCPAGPELTDFFGGVGAAAEVITGVTAKAETLPKDLEMMRAAVGTVAALTDQGRQLASVQVHLSGGPRPFAVEGLQGNFLSNMSIGVDALVNPTTPMNRAMSTDQIAYRIDDALGLSADVLNSRARRKKSEAGLRTADSPYRELVPLDGRIERPLLTMHTTGDLLVPIWIEQGLKRAVSAAGRDRLLVQRIYRAAGHCTFSDQETSTAFDDLVSWVRNGKKPAGDNVLGDLSDAGRQFTNPLRPGDPGTLTIGRK